MRMLLLQALALALLVKIAAVVSMAWLGSWVENRRLWHGASVVGAAAMCSTPILQSLQGGYGMSASLVELSVVVFEAGLLALLIPLPRTRALASAAMANVALFGAGVIASGW